MEEELRGLIKLHSSGGDNSDRERGAMLSSVLDLKIITVEEIMKQSDVVMIDYKMDYPSILKQVRESSYTRHPVFSGKIENIIGVLHVKDILKNLVMIIVIMALLILEILLLKFILFLKPHLYMMCPSI